MKNQEAQIHATEVQKRDIKYRLKISIGGFTENMIIGHNEKDSKFKTRSNRKIQQETQEIGLKSLRKTIYI